MVEALRRATVGDYEVRQELGRGGMAVVYLAHDLRLNKKVALKALLPHLQLVPGMTGRFLREAQIAAGLEHTNIIPIYGYRETEGCVYFSMRYVAGTTLASLTRRTGQLPIPLVRALLWDIGTALSFAHAHGVLHRDVKPGNVMLGIDGSVFVTDFGIARQVESEAITLTGQLLGTPAYMSPEQCRGQSLSSASDQYALGVTAFEMLAGRPPFISNGAGELMALHLTEPAPNLTKLRPDCPKDLAAAVSRMLAKEPNQRFASIDLALTALRAAAILSTDPARQQLRQWVQDASQARSLAVTPVSPLLRAPTPVTPTAEMPASPPVRPGSRKTWKWAALAAGCAAAVAALAFVVLTPSSDPKPDTPTTQVDPPPPPPPPSNTDTGSARKGPDTLGTSTGKGTEGPLPPKKVEPPVEKNTPPVLPSRGTLVVRQRPSDGTVRIDGRQVSGSRFELDSAVHRVVLEAPGFTLDTAVRVIPGRTATLAFAAPPPKPRVQGALMLRVRPFAKIFVDGRLAAEDELLVLPLLEGEHRLRIEKAGFATVDTTVVVAPRDTIKKLFTLKPGTP